MSVKSDVKMLAAQHGFGIRNEYDRLRVVDNHRWAGDCVSDLELVEQEDGRVVDAPDAVKVHGVR